MYGSYDANQRTKLTARKEKERVRKLELKLQERLLAQSHPDASAVQEEDKDTRQHLVPVTLKHVTFQEDPEYFESSIQLFDADQSEREDEDNHARDSTDIVPRNGHAQCLNPFGAHNMKEVRETMMTAGSTYIKDFTWSKTENNTYNSTYYQSSSTPWDIQKKQENSQGFRYLSKPFHKLYCPLTLAFCLLRIFAIFVIGLCSNRKIASVLILVSVGAVCWITLCTYIADTTTSILQNVSSWTEAVARWIPVKYLAKTFISLSARLGWMTGASTTVPKDVKSQTETSELLVFNAAPIIEHISQVVSVIAGAHTVARAINGLVARDSSPQPSIMTTIVLLGNVNKVINEWWAERLCEEFRTLKGQVIRLRDIEAAATTGGHRAFLCKVPAGLRDVFGFGPMCGLRERLLMRLQEAVDTTKAIREARRNFALEQDGITRMVKTAGERVCLLQNTFANLEDMVLRTRGPSDWSLLAGDEEQTREVSTHALHRAEELLRDNYEGLRMSCRVMKVSVTDALDAQRKITNDDKALTHVVHLLDQTYKDVELGQLEVAEGAIRAGRMMQQLLARQEEWRQSQV